jgi:micrococcal nuclease
MKRNSHAFRWALYAAFVMAVFLLFLIFYPSFFGLRVKKVLDGDTIVLNNGETVRYIGMDAPEEGEPFSLESTEENRRLLQGKRISLQYDIERKDRYGRVLAYVWMDTLLVNAELVKQGLASVYLFAPNLKYHELFTSLQKQARKESLGIWSIRLSPEDYYVASRRSRRQVFHRPDCEWAEKVKAENLIRFETKDEALDSGYSPCRTCKP